jgi:regulation of enolase protein 1 (concanavalin A-like superfamily)
VEIYYSLDGKTFITMRLAYFPEIKTCMVGLIAASPKGEGFGALFEDFEINALAVFK